MASVDQKPDQDNRVSWSTPLCLVDNNADGQFKVVETTRVELQKIRNPLVILSIIGPYRSGKSYLMNRLAGVKKGFELGNSIQAETKGIWAWCLPHPLKADHQLLLLDTEGLGDVEKVTGTKNDVMLFLLVTLLSSCLIYNSRGTIDKAAIDNLKFVANLADKFSIRERPESAMDEEQMFGHYFPSFIWVVRDFTLDLKLGNEDINADEYLANSLKLCRGSSSAATDFNLARRCITQYFPDRKCFVLPPPVSDSKLYNQLGGLSAEKIEIPFLQKVKELTDHVMSSAPAKSIGGIVMTGETFSHLVNRYTSVIVPDKIFSIESVVKGTVADVNRSIVEDSINKYRVAMETLALPSSDEQALMSHHESCVGKVKDELNSRCVNIDHEEEEIITQLMEGINKEFATVKEKNDKLSFDKWWDLLNRLTSSLRSKMQFGDYHTAGGYSQYEKDFDDACQQYLVTAGRSVMATKVLNVFITNSSVVANGIMVVDKTLSEEIRNKEEARRKEEAERLERENAKRKQEDAERILEEQRRRQTEFEKTMHEKFEEQIKRHKEELRRFVRLLTLNRDRLKRDGITEDADNLDELIGNLSSADTKRQQKDSVRRSTSNGKKDPYLFRVFKALTQTQ